MPSARAVATSSMPDISGMRWSVMSTSTVSRRKSSSAAVPPDAVSTR